MTTKFSFTSGFSIPTSLAGIITGLGRTANYDQLKEFFGENSTMAIHDPGLLYQFACHKYRRNLPLDTQDLQLFADVFFHAKMGCLEPPSALIQARKVPLVLVCNEDVLARLGISLGTLNHRIRNGKFPAQLQPGSSPRMWSFQDVFRADYASHNPEAEPETWEVNSALFNFLRRKIAITLANARTSAKQKNNAALPGAKVMQIAVAQLRKNR